MSMVRARSFCVLSNYFSIPSGGLENRKFLDFIFGSCVFKFPDGAVFFLSMYALCEQFNWPLDPRCPPRLLFLLVTSYGLS